MQKKNLHISIISFAFFETTIPLAKHLSKSNKVTLYALFSKNFLTPPNFDIKSLKLKENKFQTITDEDHYIAKYLKKKVDLVIGILGGNIIKQLIFLYKIADKIKSDKTNVIHFIGDHPSIYILNHLLFNENCIHTFHEYALTRITPKSKAEKFKMLFQKYRIKQCIKQNAPIIFHSLNVQQNFKLDHKYDKTTFIPFGLFEIYENNKCDDMVKYNDCILFFGYVHHYKGADIFVQSIKIFNEKFPDNKQIFLIAGKGASIFQFDESLNLKIIDKFLNDFELANLIRNCKFIVGPHRTASQSGIPNTAFVFKKPVICSNIPGLSEFITDGKNGLLFEPCSPKDLAEKIIELNTNKNLYNDIVNWINTSINQCIPSWDEIANLTQKVYNDTYQ